MKYATFTPGVYQHYKGGTYVALGLQRHANTGEIGVCYLGVQPHEAETPMLNWRPLHGEVGWLTPVKRMAGRLDSSEFQERFVLLWAINLGSEYRPQYARLNGPDPMTLLLNKGQDLLDAMKPESSVEEFNKAQHAFRDTVAALRR